MHEFRARENGQGWEVEIWEFGVYEVMNMNNIIQEAHVKWKETMYEDRALGNIVKGGEKVKITQLSETA